MSGRIEPRSPISAGVRRLGRNARTPLLLAVAAFALVVAITPVKSSLLLTDLNGDTVPDSGALLLVQSAFPVNIRTALFSFNFAEAFGFDASWPTAGPGGLEMSLPAATDRSVGVVWDWETYRTVFSLPCDPKSATRPCISFDPQDGGDTRGPFSGVPGRSLSATSVTPTSGQVATTLLIFFSPLQPLLEITSSVRQTSDGNFEYETMAESTSGEEIEIEFTAGPLECDTCINLADDERHCGGCGIECGIGECCSNDPASGPICVPSEGPCPVCGNGEREAGDIVAVEQELLAFGSSGYAFKEYALGDFPQDFSLPGFSEEEHGFGIGTAPFGTNVVCGANFATGWSLSSELLVRHHVEVPSNASNLRIRYMIDNDIQVFFNGVELTDGSIHHEGCFQSNQHEIAVPNSLLQPGSNLLAVRGTDSGGDSGLDLQVLAEIQNVIVSGEECDGEDLGETSCEGLGFCGGVLGCDDACGFDTSGCLPCEGFCDFGQFECGESCCFERREACVEDECLPIMVPVTDTEAGAGIAQIECSEGFANCAGACEFPGTGDDVVTISTTERLTPFPDGRIGRFVVRERLLPGQRMLLSTQTSAFPAKEVSSQVLACGESIPGGSVECPGGGTGALGMVNVLVPDTSQPIGDTFLSPFAMEIREPSGNGNAEPGESIQVILSLINAGPIGVNGVSGVLSSPEFDLDGDGDDDSLDIAPDPVDFPDIPGFSSPPSPSANGMPFVIDIPENHPEDTVLPLALAVSGMTDTDMPFDAVVNFTLGVGSRCVPGNPIGDFDTLQGFLSPLNQLVPEGDAIPYPNKAYKQGRTLPLKLRLGCGGEIVGGGPLAVPPEIASLERTGEVVELPAVDLDAGASNDNGLQFRFHAGSGKWIYNLKTSDLSRGRFVIGIRMPNGSIYNAGFDLR